MSLMLRLRAQARIAQEASRRRIPDPTFKHPALEHIVGRDVALVGEPDSTMVTLAQTLEAQGFRVQLLDADEWSEEPPDTVVVFGQPLNRKQVSEFTDRSLWATVFCDCRFAPVDVGGPTSRGITKAADGVYVVEKYGHAPVRLQARVVERSRTDEGWEYCLVVEGSPSVLRATGDGDGYRNGQVVLVTADEVVVADQNFGLVGGVVRGEADGDPDSMDFLQDVAARGFVREVSSMTVDSVLQHADIAITPTIRNDARRILTGFAGDLNAAAEVLRIRLVETRDDDDQFQFQVSVLRFHEGFPGDRHHLTGVVLEPDTPYGPQGIWFSRETIAGIATGPVRGALNHQDVDDSRVRVTKSFIDDDGEHARPGSWIVECEVDQETYEAVLQGKYKGFSVKGRAVLAGDEGD